MKIEESKKSDYDVIICGGGLAGLSLAYRAFYSSIWINERVLIIEEQQKHKNDRFWSFWENGKSDFESIVYRRWNQLTFFKNNGKRIDIDHIPYVYKLIRSSDFYQLTQDYLQSLPNVDFLREKVLEIESSKDTCSVKTNARSYSCQFVFSSIYQKPKLTSGHKYLLQHFKGITIRTDEVIFNTSNAWIMDFRTRQEYGATFLYALPMNKNEIFIEYTLFSKDTLLDEDYDAGIHEYINQVLGLKEYQVLESEAGVIPMTNYHFPRRIGNVTYLGTVGGDTRGSTGYTFSNLQKTITRILDTYKKNGTPIGFKEHLGLKTSLYDGTFLNVLEKNTYPSHEIFSSLFEHVDGNSLFQFLDGESTILTDVKIMSSLRTWPFLKAFFLESWRRV